MIFCLTAPNEGAENRNPRFYHYFANMFFTSLMLFVHTQYLLLHRHVMSVGSNFWGEPYLNQTSQCLFILQFKICSRWFQNSFDKQIRNLINRILVKRNLKGHLVQHSPSTRILCIWKKKILLLLKWNVWAIFSQYIQCRRKTSATFFFTRTLPIFKYHLFSLFNLHLVK